MTAREGLISPFAATPFWVGMPAGVSFLSNGAVALTSLLWLAFMLLAKTGIGSMRLTLQTDYALRTLIYLAIHQGRPCRVSDVAEEYGISRSHLLKVALRLGRLGYLTTARGRTGGIALGRRPVDINLGEVVRHMEDDFALTECMRQDGGLCVISPVCRLKGVVGKALEAFLAVFDDFTLADIAKNKSDLAELLEMSRVSGKVA